MDPSKQLKNKLLCLIEWNTKGLGELMEQIAYVKTIDPSILDDIEIKHAMRVLNEQFLK